MRLRQYLTRFRRHLRRGPQAQRPQQSHGFHPELEVLEDRTVLSPTFGFATAGTENVGYLNQGTDIATDRLGNSYVVGGKWWFQPGSPHFPGSLATGPVVAGHKYHVWVAKVDPTGNVLWKTPLGVSSYPGDIAVDPEGQDIFVTGSFWGGRNAGGSDIFVCKLNHAGTVQWVQELGGPGNDHGAAIARSANGTIHVAGTFQGKVGSPGFGHDDVFVWELNSDGGTEDFLHIGGPLEQQARDIAVDGDGNVYVAGRYHSKSWDTDPSPSDVVRLPETVNRSWDGFVLKLNSDYQPVQAQRLGGRGNEDVTGLAVDTDGNVYLTGHFSRTASFPSYTIRVVRDEAGSVVDTAEGPVVGPSLTGAGFGGSTDIFVAKLDSNGNALWAQRAGGSNVDRGNGIALDRGNAYVTGQFYGTATFGDPDHSLTSRGGMDIFVWKLDGAGSTAWAAQMGGPNFHDSGLGIAVSRTQSAVPGSDLHTKVHTTGYFEKRADFDPTVIDTWKDGRAGTNSFISMIHDEED